MGLTLRLATDSDLPDLQRLYDSRPEALRRRLGTPAAADQAARDFVDALKSPGRFQFSVLYGDDLIGMVDCKLDDEEEGLAHVGMILLAPAYNDSDILALVVRVIERWLGTEYKARRVEVSAPASAPDEITFWQAQGYAFTGAQYRRELPGHAPRFLVLARDLN